MASQSFSDIPSSFHNMDLTMASQLLSDMHSSSHSMDLTMTSQSLSDMPSSSDKTNLSMASQSLSDLPPEVIIGIFSCLKDHRAITALNLTSRKFYEIWKLNTATITNAVLPRAIDCFDLAQELLAVQGRLPNSGQAETREAVLKRSKHLLLNAAVVVKDYTSSILVFDAGTHVASLRSYYHVWIIIELRNNRQARSLRLQAATLEELRGMAKTFLWLFVSFNRGGQCVLDASGPHSSRLLDTIDAIKATLELRESLS